MQGPTFVALSAQVALHKQLEVVANNVANANTVGFKPDRQLFQSYVERLAVPGGSMSFVQDRATYIDLTDGPVQTTGNPLDVAVRGDGFLAIAGPSGTLYTRDGHLQLGADGTLQNMDGLPVLGPDRQPLQLPVNGTDPRIDGDGTITVRVKGVPQQVGQIGMFRCADPLSLRKAGSAQYSAPDAQMQAVEGADTGVRIIQGSLEGSGVQAVREIANLTELSRAYDRLQTLLSEDNDRSRKMIEILGQPG